MLGAYRVMEEMFVRNGVPYQLIGATKFYERKEVKDLLVSLPSPPPFLYERKEIKDLLV